MTLFQDLQNAGLPVISATEEGEIEMGPMDEVQYAQYSNILLQDFQPAAHQKKLDDELRIANLDSFIISSGLVDKHLSTVNNNPDRDALFQVICFKLGICDAGGTIRLSTWVPPVQPTNLSSLDKNNTNKGD